MHRERELLQLRSEELKAKVAAEKNATEALEKRIIEFRYR